MPGSANSALPFVAGYRLDRYELLCPVAQGGMAAVWLARMRGKHGFEKLVAIKTILPRHAELPQFRRMFLDEATIASRIEHGNVAQILDLGEHEGTLYLVMEWVEGESLWRLDRTLEAAGQDMPLGIALRIAAEACAGLHAAHELSDKDGHSLGVVHRDVSPQNVLVSAKGVVKVIDFGIAMARGRVSEETSAGTMKGKLHYMAPEHALGKRVDRRADVWAVGALLYRVLARRPVYDGDSQLATLHSLTTNERPKPLPDSVPPGVAQIIERALAFDPDQRFQSCAELKAELEAALLVEKRSVGATELSAFVLRHLGERIEGRRAALHLALEAANERSELHSLHAAEATVSALEPQPQAARHWSSPPPQDGSITSSSATLDTGATGRQSGKGQRWLAVTIFAAAAVVLFVSARYMLATQNAAGARRGEDVAAEQPPGPTAAQATPATAEKPPLTQPPTPAATTPVPPPALTAAKRAAAGAPHRGKQKYKIVDDGF